jgi:hypothetical protein
MGEVRLGREVAIKVLPADRVHDEARRPVKPPRSRTLAPTD